MRAFWRRAPLRVLGHGVWRRAHDRFRRAVDRYHQMIESVDDGRVRDSLEADGVRLAAALDDVLEICTRAQATTPSEAFDVPTDADRIHRLVSQAANSAAQAAEGAAMARVAARAGDEGTALARAAAAGRAVDGVLLRLGEAALPPE